MSSNDASTLFRNLCKARTVQVWSQIDDDDHHKTALFLRCPVCGRDARVAGDFDNVTCPSGCSFDAIVNAFLLECNSDWSKIGDILGPIAWDWPGYLPRGFVTMLVAEVGAGKSALALRVAGSYLRGDQWPDGTAFAGDLGYALWLECEGAQAMNLSRARAWGLPIDKILTAGKDPLADVQLDTPHGQDLVVNATNPRVRLIILDSLRASHTGDENSSESISILKFLSELARDKKIPVLVCHHLRKKGLQDTGDGISLDRVRGSSALLQLARIVWALDCPDPARPQRRRLSVIKSNLGKFPPPIGFEISDSGITFADAPHAPKTETLTDRAGDLLLSLLAHGPKRATELQAEIEQSGLSWKMAQRAKSERGILSVRKDGVWLWSLPAGG